MQKVEEIITEENALYSNRVFEYLTSLKGLNQKEKVVQVDLETAFLIDFSVKELEDDEEESKQFLESDQFLTYVRRGCTFIRYPKDKNVYLLRKGYQKFCYQSSIPQKVCDVFDLDQFNRKTSLLEKFQSINLQRTNKEDGSNVQISWCAKLNCWVICSKNEAYLIKNLSKKYLDKLQPVIVEMAKLWFKFIDTLPKEKLAILQEFCSNKTLIGEICGANKHLKQYVTYKEEQLVFLSIVDNFSDQICYTPIESAQILNDFGLNTVKIQQTGEIASYEELQNQVNRIRQEIATGSFENYGEGEVLYYCITDKEQKKTVVLMEKIKTFEYSLFKAIIRLMPCTFKKNKNQEFNLKKVQYAEENLLKYIEKVKEKFFMYGSLELYYKMVKQVIQFYLVGGQVDLLRFQEYFISFKYILQKEQIINQENLLLELKNTFGIDILKEQQEKIDKIEKEKQLISEKKANKLQLLSTKKDESVQKDATNIFQLKKIFE
ncbi:hypothetical protein TTHERM_00189480 (macronuclear) [Tetrahymena thermophila SB210]|uniref:RNA ligase domain-containing protein n=1 Tax=Tetrahymena thermophila (strain SB210) TaxID=312017 RepID=I7LUZ9_TETTS|nr:hypothetical protein TTHERM_00189480 [Tetrahymena thermophila SB210]EAR96379.1 hypothetical protein TTHERM_00189480 [Tetrahymena thermophila SB210]|eukprot:XP_001016624.1 hypothetical protein TTHERM_00189480 [Tetrahymena thermophila SB210]